MSCFLNIYTPPNNNAERKIEIYDLKFPETMKILGAVPENQHF